MKRDVGVEVTRTQLTALTSRHFLTTRRSGRSGFSSSWKQRRRLTSLLPPQLNVFYNIRSEELMKRRRRDTGEHEAFHLYVELFDEEMNSAHLSVCCR